MSIDQAITATSPQLQLQLAVVWLTPRGPLLPSVMVVITYRGLGRLAAGCLLFVLFYYNNQQSRMPSALVLFTFGLVRSRVPAIAASSLGASYVDASLQRDLLGLVLEQCVAVPVPCATNHCAAGRGRPAKHTADGAAAGCRGGARMGGPAAAAAVAAVAGRGLGRLGGRGGEHGGATNPADDTQ